MPSNVVVAQVHDVAFVAASSGNAKFSEPLEPDRFLHLTLRLHDAARTGCATPHPRGVQRIARVVAPPVQCMQCCLKHHPWSQRRSTATPQRTAGTHPSPRPTHSYSADREVDLKRDNAAKGVWVYRRCCDATPGNQPLPHACLSSSTHQGAPDHSDRASCRPSALIEDPPFLCRGNVNRGAESRRALRCGLPVPPHRHTGSTRVARSLP